jgi:hypothetical protein
MSWEWSTAGFFPACIFSACMSSWVSAFAIDDSWLGPIPYVELTSILNCVSTPGKTLAELPEEVGRNEALGGVKVSEESSGESSSRNLWTLK